MAAARAIGRRDFLRSGLVTIGAVMAGPALWRLALASPAQTGESPYGPLGEPDENGVMLPEGFRSRVIARAGLPVALTGYPWHTFPDGGAVFDAPDGGWVYVSNSETPLPVGPAHLTPLGGASAIRFDAGGEIVDAYRILLGTSANCAGGHTPWGTWLSCEEHDLGRVWECDPFGDGEAVAHPAMGVFKHEAAAVDGPARRVYLTEDQGNGRFYRYTYDRDGDLSTGLLEAAQVTEPAGLPEGQRSQVVWHQVPDPLFTGAAPTRSQLPQTTAFHGGEGTWLQDGIVYFTTKGDNRVWAYRPSDETIEIFYDDNLTQDAPLTGVDNITGTPSSGDLFVAEDGGNLEVVIITPDRVVAPLLRLTGDAHRASEISGPALRLDPAGGRLYFSSQRGFGAGVTYEVRGPFRATA